jgi:N4-gp56 family major capsid protein
VATTTPTNVDTSIPEVWAADVLRRHKAAGFWGRFVGSAIVQKSELLNKPGDLIHIQVTDPLSGAGVSGDTATLIGNEENLTTSEIKAAAELKRHAVRVNRRANKKSILDLRSEATMRLAEWGETKMDSMRFSTFTGLTSAVLPAALAAETYTPNVFAIATADSANDAGTTVGDTREDVALADTLTVKALQIIKLRLTTALAKPVSVDGFPHYALVTSPYATFQLKQESRYESWVREAHVRGADNPFFRGAIAVIDGMVIYEHPSVPRSANTAGVQVADGIAFGAEAFVEALDEQVHSNTETFDYGLEFGISYEFSFGPRRALELSSLQVKASAPTV